MRNPFTTACLALFVGGLALATGGCIFSPDSGGEGGGGTVIEYVWPDTEDKLMTNFRMAYDGMDLDGYRDVLYYNEQTNEQYQFIFSDQDIANPDMNTDPLTRDMELAVAEKMFTNQVSQAPGFEGTSITDIQVNRLDRVGQWQDTGSEDPLFPNARMATYDVEIFFLYTTSGGDDSKYTVRALEFFYAKSEIIPQDDGTSKIKWYLFGQKDPNVES